MIKDNVKDILHQCIEHATEDELKVIHQLLAGMKRKKENINGSLIGGILHMDKIEKENFCQITIPINDITKNSINIVHGGITATVLDTAMGTLANTLLPEGYGAVTSNLSIHYIAPGKGSNMKATAQVIHKGSQTLVIEGSAYCDDGKKIAHCTGTFHIIKKY
jgi:uncharacterized protein (TIGR00369 family)